MRVLRGVPFHLNACNAQSVKATGLAKDTTCLKATHFPMSLVLNVAEPAAPNIGDATASNYGLSAKHMFTMNRPSRGEKPKQRSSVKQKPHILINLFPTGNRRESVQNYVGQE